ncbi:MAG: riboflavin synthase [Candidatus Sulfobium sp.]|jgi:riboflavin synthase
MFTGLIAELGEVAGLGKGKAAGRLDIQSPAMSSDAAIGDSIAVNGVCLTVVGKRGDLLAFDLSDETLKSTNLGRLRLKDRVNLEPSLRADSRLGGHFVTGHIDGVGSIRSKAVSGEVYKIAVHSGAKIADLLVEKGSVALDGISLTVVEVFREGFSTVIIPHTAKMTTVGYKEAGDSVNIEADILGKYVARFLGKRKDSGFMQALVEEGFA